MTTTSKKFPNHYESTEGGHYRPFTNLKNIKTVSTSTYASTDLIHGKKAPLNRPGTVTVNNFKLGLQTGSKATKITVHYAHSKVAYNNKVCNIPAPTITLMKGNKPMKWTTGKAMSKKVKAPITSIVKGTVAFNHDWTHTELNASDFGVKIDYPANTNENGGYMRLYYVYIIVEYSKPSFNLVVEDWVPNVRNAPTLPAHQVYNGASVGMSFSLFNLNFTDYAPTMTITVPPGFTLTRHEGEEGSLIKKDTYTYMWKPKSLKNWRNMVLVMDFDVDVTFLPGQQNYPAQFGFSEDLTGRSHSLTMYVMPRPANIDVLPSDESDPNINNDNSEKDKAEIISVNKNQGFNFDLEFPEGVNRVRVYCCDVGQGDFANYDISNPSDPTKFRNILYYWDPTMLDGEGGWNGAWNMHGFAVSEEYVDNFYPLLTSAKLDGAGPCTLVFVAVGGDLAGQVLFEAYIDLVPSNISLPMASILSLSKEEEYRLGDETYIVQSFMKEITGNLYVRDWGKNFKIGVFNNAIEENITIVETVDEETGEIIETVVDSTDYESLSSSEIIGNADYWSSAVSAPNEYCNVECKFHYNKEYPLYIIIAGDYPVSNGTPSGYSQLSFTEPCIIEEDYYDNWESNGTYPIPIEDTKATDGSFSQINIAEQSTGTPLIYYDFPFDTDYGTNEQYAIRGIEVTGTIEQDTDGLTIYAKLKSPTGESRVRSINIEDKLTDTNEFVIGGMGDLWGFSTTEMTELAEWEIEFMVDNSISSTVGTLNYSNIALTLYIAERNEQNIQCYVDGEDISYYGAFITNVEVPEGLNTDTNYLTIDGTDTNDPYRQNIREKEIIIELDIGDSCSLADNTLSLRDLTRLFVNKRDQYNRPIPKRIEFSHYPDIYWEYVMEDTFDNPVDINSYGNVKIKLKVPAGTAYKKTETSTNRVGYVNGLASVNPVITVRASDELITITETLSDQAFSMGTPADSTDKIIVIDCEDRIVWLKDSEDDDDGENITQYVDFNSDWFNLIDEYSFESTGCALIDVSYVERW